MRLFDIDKMHEWMSSPDVNGIGNNGSGNSFPVWVWKQEDGALRFFDPDGLEIVRPKSSSYNSERAMVPPPRLARVA